MPGILAAREWPAWPEFVSPKDVPTSAADEATFQATKAAVIQEYGEKALTESWIQTCAELEKVTAEIVDKDRDMISILKMEDIVAGRVSDETRARMKETGCFVVQNVIDPATTNQLFADLDRFTEVNKGRYRSWPEDNPSIFTLFNTPTQNAARTHPNQLQLMKWINNLWHWSESSTDVSAEPLLYADAVRKRPAGSPFLGLGPHIDGGSLCRWADPVYKKAYHPVFAGNPEEVDVYDLDARKNVKFDLFPGRAHTSVFRSFQGWTALTRTAPREGTILLYPNVKTVIAYVLLRPFFQPPEDPSKVMDASQWKFDPNPDQAFFPGTKTWESQRLSALSHPHLRLKECLVAVPELQPGDTVWWHTDVCHAVDAEHIGKDYASVVYIAAVPTTTANKEYTQQQYLQMAAGLPPKDGGEMGVDESKLEGWTGFSENSELVKRLMGF
ncbi:hypothetical protein A1O3_07815 [Capronia epimyces CBS 606.96]|uniref:DUF1479 domain protein n=1 Tax=Capronia epimyces CBS 606.96 TaxID=1182542 RepID=W9XRC1_9EURO|nr:uncharacterized protein A1O3_07815 [Capronia epimyces CBS 606.96]EXJ79536.1 hypothetical protein A1O3_07815 [Capronia epimyces CBS 606.96]